MAHLSVKEMPPFGPGMFHRNTILQALLIIAAGFWAFSPTLHGDWLLDDFIYYPQNPLLGDPDRLWKIWFQPGSFTEYYPIESTVGLIQWNLWHNDTFGYHLTNILLHLVSALLVWRLLSKFGLRLAWLGGLIFAVHPAMVESVSYLAELKNTLSLPPFLLAICAWIDYEEHHLRRDYVLALGLFLTAMLCKVTMMTFPLVILLYAWWKRDRIEWKDVKASAPFFFISLVLSIITMLTGAWFIQAHSLQESEVPVGGLLSRLTLAGLSFSFYFSRCFLPVESLPIYPLWKIDPPSLLQFLPWPIFGGAAWWLWSKRQGWGRHAWLGFGFFFLNLLPFLGFLTVSYMSFTWVMDHFLYIPIIGLIGLTVAGLGQVEEQLPRSSQPYGIGLVALAIAFLTIESHAYAGMFINQETLWTYTVERNPGAWPARNNLASVMFVSGRTTEAIKQYEAALQINPHIADLHYNLGGALMQTGHPAEAMKQYQQALACKPTDANARAGLGNALALMGHLLEAAAQYQSALDVDPKNAIAHFGLGNLFAQSGHLPEAEEQYQQAVTTNPAYVEAHSNLGNVFLQTSRLPQAVAEYKLALRINPNDAGTRINLGTALLKMGQVSEAIDQYQKALEINPDAANVRELLVRLQDRSGTASEKK